MQSPPIGGPHSLDHNEGANPDTNDPRTVYHRFGGREVGMQSNDTDPTALDFDQSVADRTTTRAADADGTFRHGANVVARPSRFDQTYQGFNSYYQGSRAGTYTVQGGESFAAIAQSLYGDASLWYKIAQANPGIGGSDTALQAGTTLRLPGGVTRTSNTASTVRPYDPGEALGDTSPTTPEPPKAEASGGGGCGIVGKILLVVVAVAVSVVTAGAAVAALSSAYSTVAGGIGALATGRCIF